jgi:hypothetical protein
MSGGYKGHNGSKRRSDYNGNHRNSAKRSKYDESELRKVSLDLSAKGGLMNKFKQQVTVEAISIGAHKLLDIDYDYEKDEMLYLVRLGFGDDTLNPYHKHMYEEDSVSLIKNADKLWGSHSLKWATDFSAKRIEAKERFRKDTLEAQGKLLSFIISCLKDHLLSAAMRWQGENPELLTDPSQGAAHQLMSFLFQQTGATSTELYQRLKTELLLMRRPQGELPVKGFEKLKTKLGMVNDTAGNSSEEISGKLAILNLLFGYFGESSELAPKVSDYRNSLKEVELKIGELCITGSDVIEQFESRYMTVKPKVRTSASLDFNRTVERLGSSIKSSDSDSIILTISSGEELPVFLPRDNDNLNDEDRQRLSDIAAEAMSAHTEANSNLAVEMARIFTNGSSDKEQNKLAVIAVVNCKERKEEIDLQEKVETNEAKAAAILSKISEEKEELISRNTTLSKRLEEIEERSLTRDNFKQMMTIESIKTKLAELTPEKVVDSMEVLVGRLRAATLAAARVTEDNGKKERALLAKNAGRERSVKWANIECHECKQLGHFKGSPTCPKYKAPGKGKAKGTSGKSASSA